MRFVHRYLRFTRIFGCLSDPKIAHPPVRRGPGLSIVEATLRFDTFRGEKSSEPARLPEMRRGGPGREGILMVIFLGYSQMFLREKA